MWIVPLPRLHQRIAKVLKTNQVVRHHHTLPPIGSLLGNGLGRSLVGRKHEGGYHTANKPTYIVLPTRNQLSHSSSPCRRRGDPMNIQKHNEDDRHYNRNDQRLHSMTSSSMTDPTPSPTISPGIPDL